MSLNAERAPYFIEPQRLQEMTTQEMLDHLDGVRERRLRAFHIHQEVEEEKRQVRDERVRARLDKQLGMLSRALLTLDGHIDKLEVRIMKVRALRLELGLE